VGEKPLTVNADHRHDSPNMSTATDHACSLALTAHRWWWWTTTEVAGDTRD